MKYIDEANIQNKKVILRLDLNVPIEEGIISDTSRIEKSLETIKYLLKGNNSLIILSHLGRVKKREDKLNNSLKVVSKKLGELLKRKVTFFRYPSWDGCLNYM